VRGLLFLLAALALAGAGCASPGEPTPRRPVIPQPVRDLEARQQGDFMVLRFTLPAQTTRNEPLTETPAIEIYRGVAESGEAPESTSRLIYTIPSEMAGSYMEDGQIVFRDAIEPGGAGGQTGAIVYEVRTRAERNRASAESNRVVARAFAPPDAVAGVSAEVNAGAIALEWQAAGTTPETAAGTSEYRVYRAEITPESAAAATNDASKADLLAPLKMLAQASEPRYRDSSFAWGRTYLYVVRTVARFGAGTVESADSNPAVITPVEGAAPAAPDGVEAVVVPATEQAVAYVSLSWSISGEAGVMGYNVYRGEQAEARGAKLNDVLLGAPTYRDSSVAAGGRYFYRITAVDGVGRESELSAAAEAQIPPQQP
jgi:hypothetical protein